MSNSVDGILQQSTKELKGAKRRSKGADRRGGERNLEKKERKKKEATLERMERNGGRGSQIGTYLASASIYW